MTFQERQLADVREFMDVFHQPYPAENPNRVHWLCEEFKELVEALFAADMVRVVDAIADIQYIGTGQMLELGKNYAGFTAPPPCASMHDAVAYLIPQKASELIWAEVHDANMRKLWTCEQLGMLNTADSGIEKFPHLCADGVVRYAVLDHGKVKKPPGWVGPEDAVKEIITSYEDK